MIVPLFMISAGELAQTSAGDGSVIFLTHIGADIISLRGLSMLVFNSLPRRLEQLSVSLRC
jgi:hypothetical protein